MRTGYRSMLNPPFLPTVTDPAFSIPARPARDLCMSARPTRDLCLRSIRRILVRRVTLRRMGVAWRA